MFALTTKKGSDVKWKEVIWIYRDFTVKRKRYEKMSFILKVGRRKVYFVAQIKLQN